MIEDCLQRLVERGIGLVPAEQIASHFIFERDGFVALVERKENGFGNIGAPGLLAGPSGFAALVWRAGKPVFAGRGFEEPATEEQVAGIRRFAADLEYALRGQ